MKKERGVQSELLRVLRLENRKLEKKLEKECGVQRELCHVLNSAN